MTCERRNTIKWRHIPHTHTKEEKDSDSDRQSGIQSTITQRQSADLCTWLYGYICYMYREEKKSSSSCWIWNSNMGPGLLSLLLKMWWWAQRKFGPHLKCGCWCPSYQNRLSEWLLMSKSSKQTLWMAADVQVIKTDLVNICWCPSYQNRPWRMAADVQVIKTDPVNGCWCPSYQNRPCEWLLMSKLSKRTLWMAADVQVIKTDPVNGLVAAAYAL